MKITKIDHIGIVVESLDKGKHIFSDLLGMEFDHEEIMEDWNVRAGFFRCGDVMLELLEPIGPGEDQEFLDMYGGGLHHICFETDDIDEAFAKTKEVLHPKTDTTLPGNSGSRIFFVDEKRIFNIRTEFLEK